MQNIVECLLIFLIRNIPELIKNILFSLQTLCATKSFMHTFCYRHFQRYTWFYKFNLNVHIFKYFLSSEVMSNVGPQRQLSDNTSSWFWFDYAESTLTDWNYVIRIAVSITTVTFDLYISLYLYISAIPSFFLLERQSQLRKQPETCPVKNYETTRFVVLQMNIINSDFTISKLFECFV